MALRKSRSFCLKRRPPRRRRTRLEVWLSDRNTAPFPGYEPTRPSGPHYFVTSLGRVYRQDGYLVAVDERLTVRLDHGRKRRSLPRAVLTAFGHEPPNYQGAWRPWIDPDGPVDELTGRLRCSIADIRITTHSEIVRFKLGGPKPTNFYPVL